MKRFDEINATTYWRPPVDPREAARISIRSILKRLGNPEIPADVRAHALAELKHQRKLLMTIKRPATAGR